MLIKAQRQLWASFENSHLETRHFTKPYFYVLNFTGWIKLIFVTVDLCNSILDVFNPIFEGQGSGNQALHNTPFETTRFQIGVFKTGTFGLHHVEFKQEATVNLVS